MANYSKIGTIIQHEYMIKVKTKTFMFTTLFGPLLMLMVIGIPALVAALSIDSTEMKLAVVDYTGNIAERVIESDTALYYNADRSEEELYKDVQNGKIDGYVVIYEDILKSGEATVYTQGGGGIGFLAKLDGTLSHIVRRDRLGNIGADEDVIKIIEKGVKINTQKITDKGAEDDQTEITAALGYILGFIIYMVMMMYGSLVLRSVVEEKSNRIIEVLASSARPFEIMMGKVIGIGAVALTQLSVWMIFGIILLASLGSIIGMFVEPETMTSAVESMQAMSGPAQQQMIPGTDFAIPDLSPWLAVGFIFYFLSGFLLYSSLFAAVGSAVDQESDAQQLTSMVTIPLIIPLLLIMNVMSNPDGIIATVLSLIPLFTPILMMVRITTSVVPIWQIILSVVLMSGTFLASIWMAGKIFRVGMLIYGVKPKFGDLIKWFRTSE